MSRKKIYTARPGFPVAEPIVHTDGDHFLDKITGYATDEDGNITGPFDFTGMTFEMLIGEEEGFEDEDALHKIPDDNIEITQDQDGADEGVNNLLKIDMEDDFFGKNGQYWQYTRLFDAAGRRFTFRGSEFIIDH